MATLSARNPTLLDVAKTLDPSGKVGLIVEIISEVNEIMDDIVWVEGNLTTGHRTLQRTGLPTPTWRKIGGGVKASKGTTAAIVDTTGMLHAIGEVDVALADLAGNTNAFRLTQDRAQIQGMGEEAVDTVFFGNETTEPEAFTGFSPRFNSLSAESGDNIIDAGGVGNDNRSIYLIIWDEMLTHGIYPKGSQAGLQALDLGKILIQDASDGNNTGRMLAYVMHYRWDMGLTVQDWRYVVRIANIDNSLLTNDAATGADLPDLMFQAMDLIPSLGRGRAAFYMCRKVRGFLRRQLSSATNMSTLKIEDVGGKMVTKFQGIPVRRVDALNVDEARVT